MAAKRSEPDVLAEQQPRKKSKSVIRPASFCNYTWDNWIDLIKADDILPDEIDDCADAFRDLSDLNAIKVKRGVNLFAAAVKYERTHIMSALASAGAILYDDMTDGEDRPLLFAAYDAFMSGLEFVLFVRKLLTYQTLDLKKALKFAIVRERPIMAEALVDCGAPVGDASSLDEISMVRTDMQLSAYALARNNFFASLQTRILEKIATALVDDSLRSFHTKINIQLGPVKAASVIRSAVNGMIDG